MENNLKIDLRRLDFSVCSAFYVLLGWNDYLSVPYILEQKLKSLTYNLLQILPHSYWTTLIISVQSIPSSSSCPLNTTWFSTLPSVHLPLSFLHLYSSHSTHSFLETRNCVPFPGKVP